ncbi:hypothetical protein [Streptomyces bluensis]|uniref:hypothetical protein n=1 Tax=Streptomyces bluensis TaxID=33897 RepID=UPI0019865617|nr:hypothetical protein [Streptomyces bluensis]GGZ86799.1 hypothetical protein GCM10010344_62890 [Streptomyces bluensis]
MPDDRAGAQRALGVFSVAGLSAVPAASATAYTVIKLAGATYLAFLGIRALIHSQGIRASPLFRRSA